jgi:predicted nuclease of restriction endonuclease-like RecB superfamily
VLPSELLIARKYRDTIHPVYAKLIRENLEIAERIISLFQSYRGRRKRELEETVTGLEDRGYDYRYVRGLYTLMARSCQFQISSPVTPTEARWKVFHAAAGKGIPSTLQKRQQILEEEATQLKVSIEELENSLYADLDEELVLTECQPIEAETLVKRYNLSLTQTLLFRSSEMEFTASTNWQRIFRGIKWLGLIYTIRRRGDDYWVKVNGPISLFKLNHRYGTSLAKLIPHIIAAEQWIIEAKVLRRRSDRQLLHLKLNHRQHGSYLKLIETPVEGAYDSLIEQDFARRFNLLHSGWKLTREPGPLPVGKRVMIPDFLFEKAGMKVYLEVAGFWTPEYLKHKLQQLRDVEEVDMIVAADRSNACQRLDKLGKRLNIIYYRGRIPLHPILDHLNSREAALCKMQLKRLQGMELELTGGVVETKQIAEQLGVLESVVEEELKKRSIPGYHFLGDILIRDEVLKLIETRLNQKLTEGNLTLREATHLIEELGGLRPTRILETLGYVIEWHGIDSEKARVYRETGEN